MLLNAQNGCVRVNDDEMDYIVFGYGKQTMIMLPGIGDGLKTAKGMAIPFALMYRMLAKDFRVYVFSRRRNLPQGYTTRDMARDQIEAMDMLGIGGADVVGVSMGGMIAQWMAIDFPNRIGKLVLAVTSSRPNRILRESINAWNGYAEQNDYPMLMIDSMRRMYTDTYLNKNRWMLPVMARFGKPKSFGRFMTMCKACLDHDASEQLDQIRANTMIIAGGKDKALGADASKEISVKIPEAKLKIFAEYGHAVYEETPEFNQVLMSFLLKNR